MHKFRKIKYFFVPALFFVNVFFVTANAVTDKHVATDTHETEIKYKKDAVDLQDATINSLLLVFVLMGVAGGIVYYLRYKGLNFRIANNKTSPVRVIYSRRLSNKTVIYKLSIGDSEHVFLESTENIVLLDTHQTNDVASLNNKKLC